MKLISLVAVTSLAFIPSARSQPNERINSSGRNKKNIRGLQELVPGIPQKLANSVAESFTNYGSTGVECNSEPLPWSCVRFSKVTFPTDYINKYPSSYLPLTRNDYPANGPKSEMLKDSTCPSVICEDDPGGKTDVASLINRVGGAPSHPACDEDHHFWTEFEEVVDFALARKFEQNTPACLVMELPDLWEGWTLEQVSEAVHNEYPGLHQSLLIDSFMPGLTSDPNIIPMLSHSELVLGIFLYAELSTWAVSYVGHDNFKAKWMVGRARPEEVAFRIHNEEKKKKGRGKGKDLPCYPCVLKEKIDKLEMRSAVDFTAYPEGSPAHPSWPAMHSAGSSLSLWLPVVCDITEEQLHQARLIDYAVAYGRTVAGVHYHEDNIAGLNMGQEIIAEALPRILNERYGSDMEAVKEKIEMYRFDWRAFEPNPGCAMSAESRSHKN